MQHLLILLFTFLPVYLIRFNIGPLPTTALEILVWIIFVVWFGKIIKEKSFGQICAEKIAWIKNNKFLFASILVFLIAATISIFTSINTRAALGEWKAFYVEPIIIFFILLFSLKEKNYARSVLIGLLLSGLVTSLLAIYQHFTGWMVPHAFWANRETYRVTAWYGFPNAVGLFLAPLFILALYFVIDGYKKIKLNTNGRNYTGLNFSFVVALLCILTIPFAVFYAKSTGAIIGILGSIGLLLIFWKQTRWYAIGLGVAGIIGLSLLPNTYPVKQELLLQDRSGQIRISIWKETARFLKDNPVAGAGFASYTKKIAPYHTTVNGEGIEIFHHPHNIFLTMWVNVGLLGLISFVGILVATFYTQYKKRHELNLFNYIAIATLACIIIAGLVDSPYIKNDLAMFFWMVIALLHINYEKLENYKT